MLTRVGLVVWLEILAEVESFGGMNFEADRFHEILIGQLPVTITVKVIKNGLNLSFRQRETPMFEEKDKFVLLDVLIIVFIEVVESFANSFPLLPDLADQLLEDISVVHQRHTSLFLLFLAIQIFVVLEEFVEHGIPFRIMAKEEASKVVNFGAQPFRKVGEIQATRPVLRRITLLHNFEKIFVNDLNMGPIDGHNVFWFDQSVMILINEQECLVDLGEI